MQTGHSALSLPSERDLAIGGVVTIVGEHHRAHTGSGSRNHLAADDNYVQRKELLHHEGNLLAHKLDSVPEQRGGP